MGSFNAQPALAAQQEAEYRAPAESPSRPSQPNTAAAGNWRLPLAEVREKRRLAGAQVALAENLADEQDSRKGGPVSPSRGVDRLANHVRVYLQFWWSRKICLLPRGTPTKKHGPAPQVAPFAPNTALAAIRSALPSLRVSDAKVARVLRDEPQRVVSVTVAELAAATDVSDATVIHCPKEQGFTGFQHLKLELARRTAPSSSLLHEQQRFGTSSPTRDIITEVPRTTGVVLADVPATLDSDKVDAVVDAILHARRICVIDAVPSLMSPRTLRTDSRRSAGPRKRPQPTPPSGSPARNLSLRTCAW